jgi:transposase
MRYLRIVLHSNNFTVGLLAEDVTYVFEKYPLKELEAFKSTLRPDAHVAVEATGKSRFFHSQVTPLVAECIVVNAGQFGVIKASVSKTDRNDASALAQFLSKGLLPSSRVKEELHSPANTRDKLASRVKEELHSPANTRDKLVKLCAFLLNKVHAHLRAYGREPQRGV